MAEFLCGRKSRVKTANLWKKNPLKYCDREEREFHGEIYFIILKVDGVYYWASSYVDGDNAARLLVVMIVNILWNEHI